VRLGPARIAGELRMGGILPPCCSDGNKILLQTVGWRLVLPRSMRPGWGDSVSATVTGDALGYLTWAGPFTGEPVRALLTRHAAPVGASIAAGAAERAMYNVTAANFIAAVMLERLSTSHDEGWRTAAWVAAAGVSVALVVVLRRRARAGASVLRTPPARSRFVMKVARSLEGFGHSGRTGAGSCRLSRPFAWRSMPSRDGVLHHAGRLRCRAVPAGSFVFEALTRSSTRPARRPRATGCFGGRKRAPRRVAGLRCQLRTESGVDAPRTALIWAVVGLILLPITEHRSATGVVMMPPERRLRDRPR
jgi:hypothetical protein